MGGDTTQNWENRNESQQDREELNEPIRDRTLELLEKLSDGQDQILFKLSCRKKRKLFRLFALIIILFAAKTVWNYATRTPPTIPRPASPWSRNPAPKMSAAGFNSAGDVVTSSQVGWVTGTISGFGSALDIDTAGDTWIVTHDNKVIRYTNGRETESFDFGFKIGSICTHDGKTIYYACDDCGKVEMEGEIQWIRVEGDDMKQLSAGDDGTVWGVDYRGGVWKFDSNGQKKQKMEGKLKQISVANSATMVGVNSAGEMVQFVEGKWSRVPFDQRKFRTLAKSLVGKNGQILAATVAGDLLKKTKTWSGWDRVSTSPIFDVAVADWGALQTHRKISTTRSSSTHITDDKIPTSPPPPPPGKIEQPVQAVPLTTTTTETEPILVYSKLSKSKHYDVFIKKHGELELLATFPSSLRHVSVSDDFITMVVGKKVFYQSWKNGEYPIKSSRMYDDEVGAFLAKPPARSWFLERGVLTVDAKGSCFISGECDYYDEKRNDPTFHSHRFETMDVSHDGSVVWGITGDDVILEWKKDLVWNRRSGTLVQVSVGDANHVWGINRSGHIFEYVGGDKWRHVAWNLNRGKPSVVRVSREGHVVLLTNNGLVYRYDRSANSWNHLYEYKDVHHLYLL